MSARHRRSLMSTDPKFYRRNPRIKGTRTPLKVIIGSIAEGSSVEEVLREYATITKEDVRAALRLAAEAGNGFGYLALQAKPQGQRAHQGG